MCFDGLVIPFVEVCLDTAGSEWLARAGGCRRIVAGIGPRAWLQAVGN